VVNREEEEEVKKKMISLWKKMGKAGEGDWARKLYIEKTRNRQAPLPPPTTPLLPVHATRLHIGLCLGRKATRRLSIMREGEGAGQRCRAHLSTAATMQTAAPFQFRFIVLLRHDRGAIFNLQPSSPPSTSIRVATSSLFIFNPPCQLHPLSPPTSTLVAIQIPNPINVLFPPLLLDDARSVVLDAAAVK
jgi:hypothetical protein